MTMKKGPSPAIVTLSLLGSAATFGTSAGITSAAAALPSMVASATGGLASVILSPLAVLGSVSASLAPFLTPFITPGLDFGAGLTRGLQDALTGGDLLTELLSVLGSGGTTTTIVAAPTVAPCPFC